jgi:hypothetical protein
VLFVTVVILSPLFWSIWSSMLLVELLDTVCTKVLRTAAARAGVCQAPARLTQVPPRPPHHHDCRRQPTWSSLGLGSRASVASFPSLPLVGDSAWRPGGVHGVWLSLRFGIGIQVMVTVGPGLLCFSPSICRGSFRLSLGPGVAPPCLFTINFNDFS